MPKPAKPNPARKAAPLPQLLVTIDERHRKLAEASIKALMSRVARGGYGLTRSPGQGLIGVRLKGEDPRACVARLQALIQEDPLAFQHTHRWIPIEAWTRSAKQDIRRLAQQANAEIAPDESWAIRVERHGSRMERDALVHELAAQIPNPNVELDSPDKTILVEALPKGLGFAVVNEAQVLSVDGRLKKDFVRFEEE